MNNAPHYSFRLCTQPLPASHVSGTSLPCSDTFLPPARLHLLLELRYRLCAVQHADF